MKQKRLFHSCVMLLFSLLVQLSFTTCSNDDSPANRIPKLSINEKASEVTSSQATLEGVVIDNGSTISRCGFLVNTAKGILDKTGIDEASVYEGSRTASGNVKVTITNLKASTTYYYCLFVVSGNSSIKSAIGNFTTAEIAEPTFSSIEEVEVGEDFVTLRCRVLDNGGQTIETLGFDYRLQTVQTFKNVPVEGFDVGSTDNTFTCTINELEPGTTYDFRATAFNGVKKGYSEEHSVKTNTKTSPTVSLQNIADENIGVNYVMVAGKIEDTGASEITERGFLVATVSNPVMGTEGAINVPVNTATNDFTATIDNLKPNTSYYVRAYAANNPYNTQTQYGYSKTQPFTTKGWDTPSFSAITERLEGINLRLSCTIDTKGVNISERGFCYSSSNTSPDLTHNVLKSESEGTALEALFQIQESTTYYIRPYIKYNLTGKEEIQYGDMHTSQQYTFTRPAFTQISCSDVTYTTAKLKATLTDNGVNITKRGFRWGKSSTPTTDLQVSSGEFLATLNDLSPNTTYYYQAYVEFELAGKTESIASEVRSFTTESFTPPSIESVSSSDIKTTSAKLSASVTANGVTIAKKGFKWGTSANDKVMEEVTTGDFEKVLSNLNANTTYYYQAYITYIFGGKEETIFSNEASFTTLSITGANVTAPEISNIGFREATATATITNNGDGTVKKKGFVWSIDWNPTLENKSGSVELSADVEFSAQLTNLNDDTRYYVRAFVTTEGGGQTITAYSDNRDFSTLWMSLPSVATPSATEITQTTIKVTSSLYDGGNTDVTELGFCWSDQDIDPKNMTDRSTATADNFTATISDTSNTGKTYYIYAFATNGKGTAYSDKCVATMKYIPGADDNPRPGKE